MFGLKTFILDFASPWASDDTEKESDLKPYKLNATDKSIGKKEGFEPVIYRLTHV